MQRPFTPRSHGVAAHLTRLTNPNTFAEPKAKLDAAIALRDSLDHYTNGPNYGHFLKRVMPLFIIILRGPCIFQSTSPEQVGDVPTSFLGDNADLIV